MPARFWHQVGPPDARGCRRWHGAVGKAHGYGLFNLHDGTQVRAHAFAWQLANHGPVLPGTVFMHTCDVRACCEPTHIIPGTHAKNVADRVAKRRSAVGQRNGFAKLADSAIPAIRERLAAGERQVDIAAAFGVRQSLISKIKRGAVRA